MNPPRLATAKAGESGSPAAAGADGSPGHITVATTIPSDDDDEIEPPEAAGSTTTQKLGKGSRATSDDQPSARRKMAAKPTLMGHRRAAPKKVAVARRDTLTGIPLTMDEDDVDIEDGSKDDVDDDVDDGFDDNFDVDAEIPKSGDDAAGLVDRPFGGSAPSGRSGLAPSGGKRTTRDLPTARATTDKRPLGQGSRGAHGVARTRSADGGGATEKKTQGKTGQGVSAAHFFSANKHQSEKEAWSAHGVLAAAGACHPAKGHPHLSPPQQAMRDGASATAGRPNRARVPGMDLRGADEGAEYELGTELLPHGMADLRTAMTREGSAAFRFAEAVDPFDLEDEWADHYGAFVAGLHDEEMALALALSEAARAQTYLALLPNSDVFIVLHGLHRWVTTPPSRSVNEGKLVAFEGETLGEKGEEPPDLLRFEGNEADLFGLLSLAQTDLALVANFYDNPGPRDTKWFGEAVLDKAHGVRLGRLIPIPTVWAAMFLDYPNIGTALRRTRALIGSVSLEKVENFKLLAYSMTYATFLLPDSPDMSSVLQLDWKRLPRGRSNMAWRVQVWQAGHHGTSDTEFDDGESIGGDSAISEPDPFMATYGGERRQRIVFPKAHTPASFSWGGSPYGTSTPGQAHPAARMPTISGRPTLATPPAPRPSLPARGDGGVQSLDIGAFMATMLQAQTENQLAIAAASHSNMVAFHTATAQANAASGGKDSRLTAAKQCILQACMGSTALTFVPPPVYKEMETEGTTTEAVGRILRRALQPVQNTLHRSNISVTPHLVLTVKNLTFSANGDKTHSGCTKGITIFAVPWKTQDTMNDEEEEEQCYNLSTLKSVADVRKHVSSGKVVLPATLLGLCRLFNNYCHLLGVLFGPTCPHLLHTRGLRDALEDNEADLEPKITLKLCLHLLWRVHHDARQFFLACERWAAPAPSPRSFLGGTVVRLVEDCSIDMMLTCPEAKFLSGVIPGGVTPAKAHRATALAAVQAAKPMVNTSIPAGCKKAVDAFNAAHPTMPLRDLIKKGGIRYDSINVGGKGDCTSFGLLGRCGGCNYRHVVCTPAPDRQATISAALYTAIAALKQKPAPSTSAPA